MQHDAYNHIRTAYLVCTEDKVLPPEPENSAVYQVEERLSLSQEKMAASVKCSLIEQVAAGHSPMLSASQETAAFIMKVANSS